MSKSSSTNRLFEYYYPTLNRDCTGTVKTDESTSIATVTITDCTICLTGEGDRPPVKMTQNLLTNSIFANLDITSTGDSITANKTDLGIDACVPSRYLIPHGRGSASCSTIQINGLGEEGMNGLYEKWRNREFPTCKQVSVDYTFKIPDQEGYIALDTSPLLESSDDGGIYREYGAILTRENTRRKSSRTCALTPSGLFRQMKDGFEAVMTGRINASFE